MYFRYFASYYLSLEKGVAIHLNKLESPQKGCFVLFVKFGLNWSSGSGEEDENV